MNPIKSRENLKEYLSENLTLINKSRDVLKHSQKKCEKIKDNIPYDFEALDAFEALTARFARTSDILTQKVFKTIFALEQENIKTFLDGANFAEKLEIIEKAEEIINIRTIRNDIAHEYARSNLNELFYEILKFTPLLLTIIENTKKYCEKY